MASSDNTIISPTVRLSFPALFTPAPVVKGDARLKYQATLVIPDEESLKPILALVTGAWKERFPGKPLPKMGRRGNPIHESSEMDDDEGNAKEGFPAGSYFIRCSSKFRPGVVDRSAEPILDEAEMYPGCYVRVQLSAYAWEHETGKGVSFNLGHVQKVKDGERLDNRQDAEETFQPIPDGEDEAI